MGFWIRSLDKPSSVLPSELIKSGKVFPKSGICWSKTVALQYARPGCHHHHHHHLVAGIMKSCWTAVAM